MNNCPPCAVSRQVSGISFSFSDAASIRRLSVKRIYNSVIFDDLGHPTKAGLYDPALGPVDKQSLCATCSLSYHNCPGHFGHIELVLPVYNPILFPTLFQLLRISCPYCQRLRYSSVHLETFRSKMLLLDAGLLSQAEELSTWVSRHTLSKNNVSEINASDAIVQHLRRHVGRLLKRSHTNLSVEFPEHTAHICKRRQELILSFLKEGAAMKQCLYCQGHFPALRKDAHAKVFEKTLSEKSRLAMESQGLVRYAFDQRLEKRADKGATVKRVKSEHSELKGKRKCLEKDRILVDGCDDELSGSDSDSASDSDILFSNGVESTKGIAKSGKNNKASHSPGREQLSKTNEQYLTPVQVREHLRLVFLRHADILSHVFGSIVLSSSTGIAAGLRDKKLDVGMFFLDVLPVPAARFRPANKLDDQVFEHPQNIGLTEILKLNESILHIFSTMMEESRLKANVEHVKIGEKSPMANSQTVSATENIHNIILRSTPSSHLWVAKWIELQQAVNALFDSSKIADSRKVATAPAGIRQLLEKKEGLFRQHMMGKRVNFAARSVISPDPYLETDEIGLPEVFATRLTYPEPVTHFNVRQLRQAVINGPDIHPGASHLQMEDGTMISLAYLSRESRIALSQSLLTPSMMPLSSMAMSHYQTTMHASINAANQSALDRLHSNKRVLRHIRNGDVVLMNRQPTLHKPGIMAHRVRVLPDEKTLRMHYANCDTYNADFDGDEMNIHFPQNEVARAEAYVICETDKQYLVPTDGTPLRGLIQDHVGVGVLLTCKDTQLTVAEYHQLVYSALLDKPMPGWSGNGVGCSNILTCFPAILRPSVIFTGKQVISTILLNLMRHFPPLTYQSKTKIPTAAWTPSHEDEALVMVDEGELMQGVLDKSQFGATAYGLVHACYELYGSSMAGRLLTCLSRVFTQFLQQTAYTCGVDDLLLTVGADLQRRTLLASGTTSIGYQVALQCTGIADKVTQLVSDDPVTKTDSLPISEMLMKKRKKSTAVNNETPVINNASDVPLSSSLRQLLWQIIRDDIQLANLDSQMRSHMNGLTSKVIDSCLPNGQRKLFPQNHMSLMILSGAKGSQVNFSQISCLLGQQELEGRRVPVMVSGKTLPSFQALDTSARAGGFVENRFLSGIRPQEYYFHCMAGREGLIDTAVKTARSGYLQRCLVKHLEGLRVHYDHTVRDVDGSIIQFLYGEDALDVTKHKYLLQFEFAAKNYAGILRKYDPKSALSVLDTELAPKMLRRARRKPEKYEPALSLCSPSVHLGAISEFYDFHLEQFIANNPCNVLAKEDFATDNHKSNSNPTSSLSLTDSKFRALMWLKYLHSLVEPGEAIGVLAAQSIGEPSTQMTLNTFHFAGHGAQNVTLGIPRLREIIMTASRFIKTPNMRLPLNNNVAKVDADALCVSLNRLMLSDIVQDVSVREYLSEKCGGDSRRRVYSVRLEFCSSFVCESVHHVTITSLIQAIERNGTGFVQRLSNQISKSLKKRRKVADGNDAEDTEERYLPIIQRRDTSTVVGRGTDNEEEQDTWSHNDNEIGEITRKKPNAQQAHVPSLSDSDSETEAGDELDMIVREDLEDNTLSASENDELSDEKKNADGVFLVDAVGPENALKETEQRRRRLINKYSYVHDYTCDINGFSWCEIVLEFATNLPKVLMISLVEAALASVIVRQVPGILRAQLIDHDKTECQNGMIATSGANLPAIWTFAHEFLDIQRIYSNDIFHILEVYGVEAARAAIKREIADVFAVYGISVDMRHLTLIADMMTFDGGFRPFNRSSLNMSTSPLLNMSFETTMQFLTKAAMTGDYDALQSPSARLVMGETVPCGTGCFDVRQPLFV